MIKQRTLFKEIDNFLSAPEAIVITGMRRTGKTTLLQYYYNKIDAKNKLLLDLENPLNRRYFEEDNYERIKSSFETLGVDFKQKSHIFLDEIQFIKNLPSVVKYFIDHFGVKFFLTGSASFYMKNLFTESLAGRKYIFELHPLSFEEFLIFKNSRLKMPDNTCDMSSAIYDTFSNLYDEYIRFGGFPGVVLKTNIVEKEKALDDIFSSFFQLEIVQLGDFRRNKIIRDLMLLLAQRLASKLDILKISSELGISRPTLNEYISFLESTYFIKTLTPFSKGKDTEIRKTRKIYLCDSGLASRIAEIDKGHLFENLVFQNLRLKGELNYYQRKSGIEIDFILNKETGYEVKLSPQKKDLNKLKGLANQLGLKEFYIVSKKYCDDPNIIYGFML